MPTAATASLSSGPAKLLARADGHIAYSDAGSGPLIVMVPGLGDLKEEYRFLTPLLAEAGYRAVAMDLRGHGDSSAGRWRDYSSSATGSDIVALVRALGGPATVIGTSMGAGAAAWAAAEAPDLINRIVLVGPFVRDIPPASFKERLLMALVKRIFVGPWAPSLWATYYRSLYPTAKPADFDAYVAALKANLSEPGRMDAVNGMLRAHKADVESRLNEIRAQALVVMGTKDPDFPDPASEATTVARLTRGTSVMIDGAGHYPHAEMPDATAKAILAFLGNAGTPA